MLDLGCFCGNDPSLELARGSGSYLGIDLSERALEFLNRDLWEAGLYGPDSRAEAREFPFTRRTFGEIGERFEIEALRGVMGRSKWALLVPGAGRFARR